MDKSRPEPGARTREWARSTVRAELARVAVEVFLRDGYESVTVADLAEAAGVSWSTFLRYLGGKDAAVLDALFLQRDRLVDVLLSRPPVEDGLTALRNSFIVFSEHSDMPHALELTRLISVTPALRTGNLERQAAWRGELAQALLSRAHPPHSLLAAEAIAATAIGCLAVAIDHWAASDGQAPFDTVIDEAFGAINGPS